MTDKELFDALDPALWPERPVQKVYLLHNFDIEKATVEEVRMTLFSKVKQWFGGNMDIVESMLIERCSESIPSTKWNVDGTELVPAVQIRLTLKNS